jgi:hypothetical protein
MPLTIALDRLVERGVVEDDVRGLAAEFERQPPPVPAGPAGSALPTSVEPVKATLSTSGGLDAGARPVLPSPVRMFTTPGGRSACWQELGEGQCGERRGLGGLEHHGVPGGQCRGEPSRPASATGSSRDDLAGNPQAAQDTGPRPA